MLLLLENRDSAEKDSGAVVVGVGCAVLVVGGIAGEGTFAITGGGVGRGGPEFADTFTNDGSCVDICDHDTADITFGCVKLIDALLMEAAPE